MKHAALLLVAAAVACAASRTFSFEITQAGEVTAELDFRAPNADWAVEGREAAVALVRVDGKSAQHVIAHTPELLTYRVFLGHLTRGKHELTVERDAAQSRPNVGLEAVAARFETANPNSAVLAHAPVLYARLNTVGRFSDVPLMAWCEKLTEAGQPVLQYTIVFSNEDGGTSTRALMARWGRTTDIEFVYRVFLKSDGTRARAIVQGPDHEELAFDGPFEGAHPLLMPLTDNNMVGPPGASPLRFQPAPVLVDLSRRSRESVVDANPWVYEVMSKELEREAKLRPFGQVNGELISNPRNYAYIDYGATHSTSAFTVQLLLKDGRMFSSDLGRIDYAISRDGWVRTTVELPPGTSPAEVAGVGFQCIVPPPGKDEKLALSGTCRLQRGVKAFLLTPFYRPGVPWFTFDQELAIPTGRTLMFRP